MPTGVAAPLPDGFPHGRAVCPVCWDFVDLENGALTDHDAFTGPSDEQDAAARAAWFNTHGWADETATVSD